MSEAGFRYAEELAKMAFGETGYGKYEDKIIKNKFAAKTVYESIKDMKTVGILKDDREKRIIEVGVPVGIVAGLVPSTNPTSTAIYKCMICMKSGNPLILSPHPAAKNAIKRACEIMGEAAAKAGAPENMFQCMEIPHIAGTRELITNSGVNLILATGGKEMVKAAYSSGVPALGVGPGNVPAFIERTADIPRAVRHILKSKTFDYGVICASEQSIVTETVIKDKVLAELKRQGAYMLSDEEGRKVGSILQKADGKLNPGIVGRSAEKIAQMAGITVPQGTTVLVYEEKGVGIKFPFSIEKLSPTLAFYTEKDWTAACERCIELLEFGGVGHSLSIHTADENIVREFALKKPVSRLLVNTPSSQGAIGATTHLAPALTLGCGSVGGSATSDNVTPLNLINLRRVAYGVIEPEELEDSLSAGVGIPNQAPSVSAKCDDKGNVDVEKIAQLVLKALKER
jgi:acetaldehyde dehydrogenase (acetylating)